MTDPKLFSGLPFVKIGQSLLIIGIALGVALLITHHLFTPTSLD